MSAVFHIDATSVKLATMADELRKAANAADGYHAQQYGGTYGPAADALVTALACGLATTSHMYFGDARDLAKEVYVQMISNGESVEYNLPYFEIEVVA